MIPLHVTALNCRITMSCNIQLVRQLAVIAIAALAGLVFLTGCPVQDNDPTAVSVTGVSLNRDTLSLEVGDSEVLVATVAPANAFNQTVRWSSSDAAIASVNNAGRVTARGAGQATITVTTVDGDFTATTTVTVSTPGGETPGGETPGGETPGGETPGGETPGGETPGGETPGGETPGGETPGGGTSDINVTVSRDANFGNLPEDIILSRSGNGYPTSVTINLANYNQLGTAFWYLAGERRHTGSSFTLNAAGLIRTTHRLTLSVTVSGTMFSRDVYVQVRD